MPEASPYLELEDLVTGYGKRQVVGGVSLVVAAGEIVALIGHNGAGKSTILKAIYGLVPVWSGRIAVSGETVSLPRPEDLLHKGVAYVPQGNRVFTDLTVHENLEVAGVSLNSRSALREGIDRIFTLFPTLKMQQRRRAGTLSGGEKQMLALGNALVTSPRVLLMDEPSLGVAPRLFSDVMTRIADMSSSSGVAVLIVEQKVREVLRIAQRVYVLRNGLFSYSGPAAELNNDFKLREVYL